MPEYNWLYEEVVLARGVAAWLVFWCRTCPCQCTCSGGTG